MQQSNIYVHKSIYVYTCTYIYIYTIHVHIYIYTQYDMQQRNAKECPSTQYNMQQSIIYVYIYIYIYIYIRTCICTYTTNIRIYIYINTTCNRGTQNNSLQHDAMCNRAICMYIHRKSSLNLPSRFSQLSIEIPWATR